ncbi:hypothetical protein JE959_000068 [Aeromonas veronii]|nr:hypothetical protein [Aeromonas veronii]
MIGERVFALASLKKNIQITRCPHCKNNTRFSFHATKIGEPFYKAWVACCCGFDPTSKKPSMRMEMSLRTNKEGILHQALLVWSDAIERQPFMDFVESFPSHSEHGLVVGLHCYDGAYSDIHEAKDNDRLYRILKEQDIPYDNPGDPNWVSFVVEKMSEIDSGMKNASSLFGLPETPRKLVWFDGETEITLPEMTLTATSHQKTPPSATPFLKAGIYIAQDNIELRQSFQRGTAHLVSKNVPLFLTSHEGVECILLTMKVLKNTLAATGQKDWQILFFDGRRVLTEESISSLYIEHRTNIF